MTITKNDANGLIHILNNMSDHERLKLASFLINTALDNSSDTNKKRGRKKSAKAEASPMVVEEYVGGRLVSTSMEYDGHTDREIVEHSGSNWEAVGKVAAFIFSAGFAVYATKEGFALANKAVDLGNDVQLFAQRGGLKAGISITKPKK